MEISIILAIVLGCYLIFISATTDYLYSSAIADLFLFNYSKWKLYKKAKKQGVRHYLRQEDYERDYYSNCIPEFYLYPLPQECGGIKYQLYTKDYIFITENFQLISKL